MIRYSMSEILSELPSMKKKADKVEKQSAILAKARAEFVALSADVF